MSVPTPEQALAEKYFRQEKPLSMAEEKVQEILVAKMDKLMPKIEDFQDIYPLSKIENDQKDLKNIPEQDAHERAIIWENILREAVERQCWLGKNVSAVFASKFDNIKHNTDLIFEFDTGDKIIRLAVDATISENPDRLENKRAKIQKDIESGKLTELDYFKSRLNSSDKGRLSSIPRVIVVIDVQKLKRLCETINAQGLNALSQADIQIELLKDISKQLRDEMRYAKLYWRKSGLKNSIVDKHQKVLNAVEQILQEKKEALGKDPEAEKLLSWDKSIKRLQTAL